MHGCEVCVWVRPPAHPPGTLVPEPWLPSPMLSGDVLSLPLFAAGTGHQSWPWAVPTCVGDRTVMALGLVGSLGLLFQPLRAWSSLLCGGVRPPRPVSVLGLQDLEELVSRLWSSGFCCLFPSSPCPVSLVLGTRQARVLLLTLAGAC